MAAIGDLVRDLLDTAVKLAQPTGLLGLVMIVKNEAHGIVETLKTFRPVIDYWTILDTGSTDGTQDIIRRELAEVAGQLIEEPFVDFSTSRNRALDLHGERTTFTIMPDSDDRLVGAHVLRHFLTVHEKAVSSAHEAYLTNIRRGELSYFLPLVTRTKANWRYWGRVHECCGGPGRPPATMHIPGVEVMQHQEAQSLEATKARWQRDLELLRADHATDPRNPRTAFYLAQTLDCLGQHEEALEMYALRVKIGGWFEETFEAKLRCARMMEAMHRPWPEVQQAYLDAHTLDKRRAEPLYAIAERYYHGYPGVEKDNLPLTYLFARRAMELSAPNVTLFVDHDVYSWKAAHLVAIAGYYLGDEALRAGARAADHAVAKHPGDELIRSNRSFYAKSAHEIFGATSKRLAYAPQEPFVASNPSIHFDGDKWRCLVRTLNYRIVDGCSYIPPDGVIQTHNVMLELDNDLEITRIVPMRDQDPTPRTGYPVHGFEDCRLFKMGQHFEVTATVCDFTVEGTREIVRCKLGDDYAILEAAPLRGAWSTYDQKNWMPILGNSELAYSLLPTVVLDSQDLTIVRGSVEDLPHANRHLRGGSQLIPFHLGYLCLVHDVTWSGSYRTYLHRFVWLDNDLVVRKMSDLFYFEHRGIEYCCGLAHDDDGSRLVASYSVNDASANLATFDPYRVLASLREDFAV
jgi:hypothetical protein